MDQTNQTQRNFAVNIVNLLVNIGIGLFYTPYLVKSLGIIAYGIVPLAFIINQYVSVVTASLTGSLTRFYSVALQNDNFDDASKYLSSALVAITAIIVAILPVFFMLIIKIDVVFNIPNVYVSKAQILFVFSILSFFVSLYSSLLNVTLYSRNRLDLLNLISMTRIIIKVVLIVVLFHFIDRNISFIGLSTFIAEIIVLILSFYYFQTVSCRKIKISVKYFERGALISIIAMTSWVILHQIGDTGLYRIDNILVNKFWSTKQSGILGALSELGTYVTTVVSVVSTLFGPLILIAYAKGNHLKVKELTLNNSLYVGVVNSLLIGVLIGFSHSIIHFWLGAQYTNYASWLVFKLITLPFYMAAGIFSFVYRAWNQVKYPAIITLIIGIVNFSLSYFICSLGNGNELFISYMLLFSVICILIQSFGLNSFFFHKIYPEVKKMNLFLIFIKITLALVLSIIISYLYNCLIDINNLFSLIYSLAVVTSISVLSGYFLFFDQNQKTAILDIVKTIKLPINLKK